MAPIAPAREPEMQDTPPCHLPRANRERKMRSLFAFLLLPRSCAGADKEKEKKEITGTQEVLEL